MSENERSVETKCVFSSSGNQPPRGSKSLRGGAQVSENECSVETKCVFSSVGNHWKRIGNEPEMNQELGLGQGSFLSDVLQKGLDPLYLYANLPSKSLEEAQKAKKVKKGERTLSPFNWF